MPRPDVQILVCTNDRGADAERASCARRGGLELYHRLKDGVRARGLRDRVLVTRTGCLRHCSRGPVVCRWPDNEWHGLVEPADADALLDAVANGAPWAGRPMPDGPWE